MTNIELEHLSKEEKRLLLYFETRCVDHGGTINTEQMNSADFEIAEKWNNCGFIRFGRISSESIRLIASRATHWCKLSDKAWELAHKERMQRFYRNDEKRVWMTTKEFQALQTLEQQLWPQSTKSS